jgi:hypothetical protein
MIKQLANQIICKIKGHKWLCQPDYWSAWDKCRCLRCGKSGLYMMMPRTFNCRCQISRITTAGQGREAEEGKDG